MDDISSTAQYEEGMLALAIDGWRFARVFSRALGKLPVQDATRFENQQRYYINRLAETLQTIDCQLVNLEGMPYDAGAAVTPINIADFGPNDQLVIDQMVEPVIMGPNGIKHEGVVMLRKVSE